MAMSSLEKKTTTAKSLVFVFLVGLLSLTFLVLIVNKVFAATAAPIAPTSTSAVGIQTITYNWTAPGASPSNTLWVVASSTNRVPTVAQTLILTPTTTVTFAFVGLATNTAYYFGAAGSDALGATSTYATSSLTYTLAATPGTTSKSATSTTSFTVTINSSTNPAATTFVVRDTGGATLQYLQGDGTWGAASSSFTAVQLGAITGTSTTGLTANTPHTISVAAVNGGGVTTSYSTAAATFYTLANTPSSAAVTVGANNLTFTWSGEATEYYVEDTVAGTNSGWITATTYSTGSINCGTARTFRVKGRNGDSVETSFSSSVDGATNACGGVGVVGGGIAGGTPATPFSSAIPATPAKPAVPGVSPTVPAIPATPASPASVSLPSTASPVAVFVHTLRVGSRSNEVKQLQQKLRELGFFTYPTNTGFFGGATRAAVVAFQKDQGFSSAPGHVGPATRAALNSL